MKIDFGVQVGGRIVDSAFTIAFNEKYDKAILCTQDATNHGLQLAGVDARFSEIGAGIEEVINSYEVELNGKTYQMKPCRNLNGHSMKPYQIHAGKSVPIVKTECTDIMEEGSSRNPAPCVTGNKMFRDFHCAPTRNRPVKNNPSDR